MGKTTAFPMAQVVNRPHIIPQGLQGIKNLVLDALRASKRPLVERCCSREIDTNLVELLTTEQRKEAKHESSSGRFAGVGTGIRNASHELWFGVSWSKCCLELCQVHSAEYPQILCPE